MIAVNVNKAATLSLDDLTTAYQGNQNQGLSKTFVSAGNSGN